MQINCKKCGSQINIEKELSAAFAEQRESQIRLEMEQEADKKFELRLETIQKAERENAAFALDQLKQQAKLSDERNKELQEQLLKLNEALTKADDDKAESIKKRESELRSEIESEINKKFEMKFETAQKAERENTSFKLQQLEQQAKLSDERNKNLQNELLKLTEALTKAANEKEDEKRKAEEILNAKAEEIRKKEREDADERYISQLKEKEKIIQQTKEELIKAQQKIAQGSEQIQGEVFEEEILTILSSNFPLDIVEEIKKGVHGADIKHIIKNNRNEDCGTILWEMKKAKWSNDWLNKLKEDLNVARANIGILVVRGLPDNFQDIHKADENGCIWIVRPKCVAIIANLLRNTFFTIQENKKNLKINDEMMLELLNYLTSHEFKNLISAVIKNHDELRKELEKEKRITQLRWKKQEKAIDRIVSNVWGLHGALQGITGNKLQDIVLLEGEVEEGVAQ